MPSAGVLVGAALVGLVVYGGSVAVHGIKKVGQKVGHVLIHGVGKK